MREGDRPGGISRRLPTNLASEDHRRSSPSEGNQRWRYPCGGRPDRPPGQMDTEREPRRGQEVKQMPTTLPPTRRAHVPYSRELLYLTLIEKQGAEKKCERTVFNIATTYHK